MTPLRLTKEGNYEHIANFTTRYNLNTEKYYYVVSTDLTHPKIIKSYVDAVYDIALLECNNKIEKNDNNQCELKVIHDVCDELLSYLFIPVEEYMNTHKNGDECMYSLLPYETWLKMNYFLKPTTVRKLHDVVMSYDGTAYTLTNDSIIPIEVKYKQAIFKLNFNDLLFLKTNTTEK